MESAPLMAVIAHENRAFQAQLATRLGAAGNKSVMFSSWDDVDGLLANHAAVAIIVDIDAEKSFWDAADQYVRSRGARALLVPVNVAPDLADLADKVALYADIVALRLRLLKLAD